MTMELRNSPKKKRKAPENNELPKEETPRTPRENELSKESEWTTPVKEQSAQPKWAFDDQLKSLKVGFVPKDL